ncbi:MAG: carboxypeptidase-like regulatory domain-containing protein [Bacteroidales bacterium]
MKINPLKYYSTFLVLFLGCNLGVLNLSAQQNETKRVSVNFENKPLEEIINYLQDKEGINFSYSKSILKLDQNITLKAENAEIKEILKLVFANTQVIYRLKAGIIILQPRPQNLDKIIIKGTIKSGNDFKPLEFAGIQLISGKLSTLSNSAGNFNLVINKDNLKDSLLISYLGFEKEKIPVSRFINTSDHIVFLKPRTENIETVEIKASDFRIKELGNHKILSFGSIYIDTQGQQTALYIENKKKKEGIISSVSYYLSKKGNTSSPFRVRIYALNPENGKPGKDLLDEVLIIKPHTEGGWYKVDVSGFRIEVPGDGFFVGMEGIYPSQNEIAQNSFIEISQFEEIPNTISYGQRLGYSNRNSSVTWHYSLTHTWFQLKDENYHVMISAEIQVKKGKRKKMETSLEKLTPNE